MARACGAGRLAFSSTSSDAACMDIDHRLRTALPELAYTDVADRQGSWVIALQPDQARRRQAVIRVLRKFARRNPALPVGTLQLIFDHLAAIEPMLHMSAPYN